jgi:hypothetical protein
MSNSLMGWISGGLTGNVNQNNTAPTINMGGVNTAVQQGQFGNDLQEQAATQTGQALQEAKGLAAGTGPSAATALLNQNAQTSMAEQSAMASSGAGPIGAGLARRQAMMANAKTMGQLGNQAATARVQEQLGGMQQQGALAGQLGQQGATQQSGSLAQAGLMGGLATSQANLQEQTNALNVQAQQANQQNNQRTLGSVAGALSGGLLGSSPKAKTSIKSAELSSPPQAKSGVVPAVSQEDYNSHSPQMRYLKQHGLEYRGDDEVVPPTFNVEELPKAPAPKASDEFDDLVRKRHAALYAGPAREVRANPTFADSLTELSSPPEAKDDITAADEADATSNAWGPSYGQNDPDQVNSDWNDHIGSTTPEHATDETPNPATPPYANANDSPSSNLRTAIGGALAGWANPASVGTLKQAKAAQAEKDKYDTLVKLLMMRAKVPDAVSDADIKTLGTAPEGLAPGPNLQAAQQELSSPPEAKTSIGAGKIEDALRTLKPYSYRYKDLKNEPIPHPSGAERFFGVMTTDLKKHPITRSMVSGVGADEKVSVPAATSFNLAANAHMQAQHDGLARRVAAIEKIMGKKSSRKKVVAQ